MDNNHKDCIDKDGKLYRYDSDYDCWYRVFTRDEYADLPHWDRYSWIYVIVALCTICYYVEFLY
jgi:hypothetical protein